MGGQRVWGISGSPAKILFAIRESDAIIYLFRFDFV